MRAGKDLDYGYLLFYVQYKISIICDLFFLSALTAQTAFFETLYYPHTVPENSICRYAYRFTGN